MPRVTALPRGQSNGENVTSFTDSVGPTPTVFTFDSQQEGLTIANKGSTDITFTINGSSYTVLPGKSRRVPALFTSFTIQSTNGVQEFEATSWDYEKNRVTAGIIQEPFVIAHRGGSNVYPENTMVAYRSVVAAGIRVIEMDVQQLIDGTLAVMHDSTVDATTSSTGKVSDLDTYSWSKLVVDASQWLPGGQNTNPPFFEDILREFGETVIYVPESKDTACAEKIAQTLVRYGLQNNAIIQSFDPVDLSKVVPYGIPTMILGDSTNIANAKKYGFTYAGFSTAATDSYIQSIIAAGIKPSIFTINRRSDWETWRAKGCVACFSDDPLWVSGTGLTPRIKDPFANKSLYHGSIGIGADRGKFIGSNKWGRDISTGGGDFILQGWGSPIAKASETYSLQFTVTVEAGNADTTRWGSCAFGSPTDFFNDNLSVRSNAYHVLFRQNGLLDLYKIVNGVFTKIGTLTNTAIAQAGTLTLKIDVTPTNITVTRTDVVVPNSIMVEDSSFRGGYFFFGYQALGVSFSDVSIT